MGDKSVQDLLAEARNLIKEKTGTSSFVNERPEGFPPRHYFLPVSVLRPETDRGRTIDTAQNNYTVINVYRPTRDYLEYQLLPTGAIIFVHSHKALLSCKPEDLCHEYGFNPPTGQEVLWRSKWGYLYPSINNSTTLDFSL